MEKSGCFISVIAVIGLSILVAQCRSCSGKKKSVQNEKVRAAQVVLETKHQESFNNELTAFLAEYDPPLSAKRGETLRAIKSNQEIRNKLRAKIDKYPNEEARAVFRTKVARYEKMIQQLNQLLTAIDKNATIAMAQQEASVDEGGGMQSTDSQTLIDSADSILKQAAALQNDLESLSSDKPNSTASSAPSLETNPKPTGTLTDQVYNKTNPDGKSSLQVPPTPVDSKWKKASETAAEIERMADKATAALEGMKKKEAAQAEAPKQSATRKATPAGPKPKPPMSAADRDAIDKEIHRLDAAIATDEANLKRAWDRVNQMTRNLTVPIVKGSRQYVEYMALERVIEDCEAQLPAMKNQRGQLQRQLEGR